MSAVATNVYCALRSDDPYTWTTTSQLNAHTNFTCIRLTMLGTPLSCSCTTCNEATIVLCHFEQGRLHCSPGKEAHRTDKISPAICIDGALIGCVILAYENIVWPN